MYVFQIIIQFIAQLCYCITSWGQISVVCEHANSSTLLLNNLVNHLHNSKNNIGPKLEPCGTPQEIVQHFDVVWLTLHICFLFVKYDLNQFKVLPTKLH